MSYQKHKLQEIEYEFGMNPYDGFMRKHLSHYGYYTGRNAGFRTTKSHIPKWERRAAGYDDLTSDSDGEDAEANERDEERRKSTQLIVSSEKGKVVQRLRAPRQLYTVNGMVLGPSQQARWPDELEVAIEKLNLLQTSSPRESVYKPTGKEYKPHLVGTTGEGRTVYQLKNRQALFFTNSSVGGARGSLSEVTVPVESPEDDTLLFESRFESGNLHKAIQVGPRDYELWVRNDLYTHKHTQWFFFRIKNTRKNGTYRITLCNFTKSDSLYNDGMRPVMYSEKEAQLKGQGWCRTGKDIVYYKSNLTYPAGKGERSYYALTFTVTFKHDDDTVYLAHCYPYTYTDLQDYLGKVTEDPVKSKICKLKVLCRSLAGNLVYIMTITSASEDAELHKNKKGIVVTARVHPGETNSSWMMKGLLDYLLGDAPDAKLLRDMFIFKVIPMLNPDGVIVGNYRCSLTGRDLNRNYKSQLKDSFPSIYHTKLMVQKVLAERDIIVYCDLHGHSRKQNVFIYGCENRREVRNRLKERVFPVMLSKNAADKFSYQDCSFKVQKSKEGTGRIVMWHLGIINSYTLEATFCGSSLGALANYQFSMEDFESMGFHFCDTLLDYCDPDHAKTETVMTYLEENLKQEILEKLTLLDDGTYVTNNGEEVDPDTVINRNLDDIYQSSLDDSEEEDGGSDSSASNGLPMNMEYIKKVKDSGKKRKKKTRKERGRDGRRQSATQDGRTSKERHHQCIHDSGRPCTQQGNGRPRQSTSGRKRMGPGGDNNCDSGHDPETEAADNVQKRLADRKKQPPHLQRYNSSDCMGQGGPQADIVPKATKAHLRYTQATTDPWGGSDYIPFRASNKGYQAFTAQYLVDNGVAPSAPLNPHNASREFTVAQEDEINLQVLNGVSDSSLLAPQTSSRHDRTSPHSLSQTGRDWLIDQWKASNSGSPSTGPSTCGGYALTEDGGQRQPSGLKSSTQGRKIMPSTEYDGLEATNVLFTGLEEKLPMAAVLSNGEVPLPEFNPVSVSKTQEDLLLSRGLSSVVKNGGSAATGSTQALQNRRFSGLSSRTPLASAAARNGRGQVGNLSLSGHSAAGGRGVSRQGTTLPMQQVLTRDWSAPLQEEITSKLDGEVDGCANGLNRLGEEEGLALTPDEAGKNLEEIIESTNQDIMNLTAEINSLKHRKVHHSPSISSSRKSDGKPTIQNKMEILRLQSDLEEKISLREEQQERLEDQLVHRRQRVNGNDWNRKESPFGMRLPSGAPAPTRISFHMSEELGGGAAKTDPYKALFGGQGGSHAIQSMRSKTSRVPPRGGGHYDIRYHRPK